MSDNQFDRTIKQQTHPDDEKIMIEQQETGKIMDQCTKHEMFLQRNRDQIINDDSLMLYRLPLSEEQRKQVYDNLTQ